MFPMILAVKKPSSGSSGIRLAALRCGVVDFLCEMVVQENYESFRFCVTSDEAIVRSVDGTVIRLPKDVLFRSHLLQLAILDSGDEAEVCLQLPTGAIDAWVEGLLAVEVATRLSDTERPSKITKRLICSRRLLKDSRFVLDALALASLRLLAYTTVDRYCTLGPTFKVIPRSSV